MLYLTGFYAFAQQAASKANRNEQSTDLERIEGLQLRGAVPIRIGNPRHSCGRLVDLSPAAACKRDARVANYHRIGFLCHCRARVGAISTLLAALAAQAGIPIRTGCHRHSLPARASPRVGGVR